MKDGVAILILYKKKKEKISEVRKSSRLNGGIT